MLVLSRKIGEKILIGDGIAITILSVNGRHVRVGVEAPREVPVLRSELRRRDQRATHHETATDGERSDGDGAE